MSLTIYTAFVAACVLLALTPGPNMSLIIANALSGGVRAGFATLAGTTTGQVVLVSIACLGMTSVMTFMSDWFDVVRWAGALYLVFLGARQLIGYLRRRNLPDLEPPEVKAATAYGQGLLVSLSNPKVLLFLGAFFPQFVDPSRPAFGQLLTLAVTFVVTLFLIDAIYTYAVGRARAGLDMRRLAALDGLAGGLLIAGGVALATLRRP
jgi:threonine/homoserine/homoserine lactone efflux protein